MKSLLLPIFLLVSDRSSFEILHEAEKPEYELQKQGVSIIAERDAGISPAAMLGVGLLLAILAQ